MKKVIVFAGSNSRKSINKQLATYAAGLMDQTEYEVLDLNDYPLPIFGVDLESTDGYPEKALAFDQHIQDCSGIILSLAEHNGSYAAVFKNLFDWLSRIEGKNWRGKPMLLMSASPGGRGGASVLASAQDRFPRHDAKIISTFSLPFFEKNFGKAGIADSDLDEKLKSAVKKFELSI